MRKPMKSSRLYRISFKFLRSHVPTLRVPIITRILLVRRYKEVMSHLMHLIKVRVYGSLWIWLSCVL
jgi:hypothetical protein